MKQTQSCIRCPTCGHCAKPVREWPGQFEETEEIDVIERELVIKKIKRKKARCACYRLFLVGAPVHGGRVPEAQPSRLGRLRASGAPDVLIAVYGNRAYEDALLELSEIASGAGFLPEWFL
jgi:hypothetical protein